MSPDRPRWWFVAGALFAVIGTVWSLQGLGLLGGSQMTDDRRWLAAGLVLIALGALLTARAIRIRH